MHNAGRSRQRRDFRASAITDSLQSETVMSVMPAGSGADSTITAPAVRGPERPRLVGAGPRQQGERGYPRRPDRRLRLQLAAVPAGPTGQSLAGPCLDPMLPHVWGSRASPFPSWSRFAWSGLKTFGHLSSAPTTPSPSLSLFGSSTQPARVPTGGTRWLAERERAARPLAGCRTPPAQRVDRRFRRNEPVPGAPCAPGWLASYISRN